MRSLKALIGIALAAVIVAILIVSQASSFVGLDAVRSFLVSFFDRGFSYGELVALRTENEALRAERKTLLEAGIEPFSYDLRKAPIYSRYPYEAQGLFTIVGGSDEGFAEGMPVLAAPGTLLGKITHVERTQSEVMTVWNPAWRSSVRFEGAGDKSLLTGGSTPLLTLIPRGKEPNLRTHVVNVDPSFPYGLLLGTVGEETHADDEPWVSALLETPYRETDLAEVLVLVNFP